MPDDQKETFVSTATIYTAGSGLPFTPGTPVPLRASDVEDFRKAGLEQKVEDKKKK